MPVEIRELVIKAIITAKTDTDAIASDLSDSSDTESAISQDEVVEESVRQVLKILQKQKER